ncbi:hypothetical protein L873DRAFT_1840413 [Choiromyces venosus 120613-1]|uniref:Uncharacterized protein n=1 Tax=Choiromyces venosus 120613-1 TaxID=1336337 RepID=A0A3N4K299_9PEZI|nr:hypothetical protein L873DRAFT_1840413 [Choiromyces venosus 120613-1]
MNKHGGELNKDCDKLNKHGMELNKHGEEVNKRIEELDKHREELNKPCEEFDMRREELYKHTEELEKRGEERDKRAAELDQHVNVRNTCGEEPEKRGKVLNKHGKELDKHCVDLDKLSKERQHRLDKYIEDFFSHYRGLISEPSLGTATTIPSEIIAGNHGGLVNDTIFISRGDITDTTMYRHLYWISPQWAKPYLDSEIMVRMINKHAMMVGNPCRSSKLWDVGWQEALEKVL